MTFRKAHVLFDSPFSSICDLMMLLKFNSIL